METPGGGGHTISTDELLGALADVQRRTLLLRLLDHDPQDDARIVVADAGADRDTVERSVSMHHVHLPKLAAYGLVEWNRDTHEVRPGPNFEAVRPLLEFLEPRQDERPTDWP